VAVVVAVAGLFTVVNSAPCPPIESVVCPVVDSIPNALNGTTNVFLSILLNAVSQVDGVDELFVADFYLSAFWYDPTVNFSDPNFQFNEDVNFDPAIEFANIIGTPTLLIPDGNNYFNLPQPWDFINNSLALVENGTFGNPGSWVQYNQRYQGSFGINLALYDFPYDTQTITITIDSSLWSSNGSNAVVFLAATPTTFTKDLVQGMFSVPEWDILAFRYETSDMYYAIYNQSYAQFEIFIDLRRQPEYYLSKIVEGMVLLVCMNFFSFTLEPHITDRMMGVLLVFLGLITFEFIASSSLPLVPYQTRIDQFMSWSFLLVAISMFVHAIMYMYRPSEEEEEEEEEEEAKAKKEKKEKKKEGRKKEGRKHKKRRKTTEVTKKKDEIELQEMPPRKHEGEEEKQEREKKEKEKKEKEKKEKEEKEKEEARKDKCCCDLPTWNSLSSQRKWDWIIFVVMFVGYLIGVGAILQGPNVAAPSQ